MMRHAKALAAAFTVRLLLVGLVFSESGSCLQHGDSLSWSYQSLGVAYGLPSIERSFWPPAFRLLLAAAFKILGFSIAVPMALQVLLGLASIALAYLIAARYFDPSSAFLSALLTALLPPAAILSLSSLAEPLYLVLMQTFFIAYLSFREDARRRRLHVAATAAMALAVVTRYEALGFYAAFAVAESSRYWQCRREGRACEPALLLSAVLAPLIVFLLWVLWVGHFTGDHFAWIRMSRDSLFWVRYAARGGPLHRFEPVAILFYVGNYVAHAYSWFLFAVPAAALCFASGASMPKRGPDRLLAGMALGNAALLAASAAVRLISSDPDRNFFVPIVLMIPYIPLLLNAFLREHHRSAPKAAATLAAAALAAAAAWDCARLAAGNSWCFPNAATESSCELGRRLRRITEQVPIPGKKAACYEATSDFSCASAIVCSGLPELAGAPLESKPLKGASSYVLGPCDDGPQRALLARSGTKCLFYGAPIDPEIR